MEKGVDRLFEIDPWLVIESDFNGNSSEISESMFSLSNEYMGTRGLFEEGFDGASLEGCYIGGIYLKSKVPYIWQRPGFINFANTQIHTTNWLRIKVTVADETFSMSDSKYNDYRRVLDMRNGILKRKLVFVGKDGSETHLCWERFISQADRHAGAIKLTVKAVNHSKKIKIDFVLDGRKENRDTGTDRIHTSQIAAGDSYLLKRVDTTGQYFIHRMTVDSSSLSDKVVTVEISDKMVGYSAEFVAQEGKAYDFYKMVSVWTSRDAGYPHGIVPKEDGQCEIDANKESQIVDFLMNKSELHLADLVERGYESLREAHVKEFERLWQNLDVEIDGDPSAQQGIRYCMFQLLSHYVGMDSYLNIAPKGHSGENYNGRAFWDSESYCLPFYLFANPQAAKDLIEYRYNGLNAARERAVELGYKGAIYPWTTLDGTEDTEVWEYTVTEIHVNSTVAYAIYLYEMVVGDEDYVLDHGVEMLIEIARFFASRAVYIPHRDGYAFNMVGGPDEWRQWVDNNWYTNFMAKWALEYAIELVKRQKASFSKRFEELKEKMSFDEAELEQFAKVAQKIILNRDEDLAIYLQDEQTLNLEPVSREELDPELDLPIDRKWTVVSKLKCQLMKQPDVLLAMMLQRHRFSVEDKMNNYRFYEQRCAHGSSLSPCVHSILASEIGRYNQAYHYYLWASRLDLDNLNFNSHEGLHISSMAGSWLTIVAGFGGMTYSGDTLELDPIVPEAWQSYSFKLAYRGTRIKVSVNKEQVEVVKLAGNDLPIKIYGNGAVITNQPLSVPLSAEYINRPRLEAVIFDLDGVIVDTAKYHYMAWKEMADKEGIFFDERINERLKGVSRTDSLEIILEKADREYSAEEKEQLLTQKNQAYVQMLSCLTPADILPGINQLLSDLKTKGIKMAVCSASKNTDKVLGPLGISGLFDVVVSGNDVTKSKPDPEGVRIAIRKLGVKAQNCVLVEDAFAGIVAGVAAETKTLGIGDKMLLHKADYVIPSTNYMSLETLEMLF